MWQILNIICIYVPFFKQVDSAVTFSYGQMISKVNIKSCTTFICQWNTCLQLNLKVFLYFIKVCICQQSLFHSHNYIFIYRKLPIIKTPCKEQADRRKTGTGIAQCPSKHVLPVHKDAAIHFQPARRLWIDRRTNNTKTITYSHQWGIKMPLAYYCLQGFHY